MNTNLWVLALSIYKAFGRDAAKRFITPPKSWIEQAITKRTLINGGLWSIAYMAYKTFGEHTAKRLLMPPQSFIKATTNRTGANYEKAIEERDEAVNASLALLENLMTATRDDLLGLLAARDQAVEENLEMLEAMLDKDFVDTDDEEDFIT